jgi:hypothetical protein
MSGRGTSCLALFLIPYSAFKPLATPCLFLGVSIIKLNEPLDAPLAVLACGDFDSSSHARFFDFVRARFQPCHLNPDETSGFSR